MRDKLDKIICWLFIFAAALLLVIIAFPRPADGKTAPPEEAEAAEPTEAMEAIAEEITPQKPEYEIPLDMELQQYIIVLAEHYDLAPELVFAVIGTESNYNPNRTGDNGNSIGLMQIQPRWHQERMDRLDVDNLYNPFENVLVGIDLLATDLAEFKVYVDQLQKDFSSCAEAISKVGISDEEQATNMKKALTTVMETMLKSL